MIQGTRFCGLGSLTLSRGQKMVSGITQWIMNRPATSVDEYLNALPSDRQEVIKGIRRVILDNLPEGYQECFRYGMIGYVVPHSLYPPGYHCNPKLPLPLANLGAQKNHIALHLMSVYGDPATEKWYRDAWHATGKKLDMGKACVRFKRLEICPSKS